MVIGCASPGGDRLDPALEPREALDDRLVFGDRGVTADDERQRFLHLAKGRDNLHQPAQLDTLGEIFRRGDEERKYKRDLLVAGGEPGEPLAAADDVPPIGDDAAEAAVEDAIFMRLAAVERDALGVLAQPHQAEAEIGLEALLVEHQPGERLADPMREPGADRGVDERREHQVSRDVEAVAAPERHRQSARQTPQDEQERHQRHHRVHHPQRQAEAQRGEAVEVVGNALVGVVGRRLVDLDAVIGLVAEPPLERTLGQPAPPADVQDLPQIELIDRDPDPAGRDHAEYAELAPELRPIVLLQGVVEIAVPQIEADIDPNRDQIERDNRDNEAYRAPFLV